MLDSGVMTTTVINKYPNGIPVGDLDKQPLAQSSQESLRIDLACGQNKREGFWGVDIGGTPDQIVNLEEYPWPWADNSVDELHCSHYIEHTSDLIKFMNECHRILKPVERDAAGNVICGQMTVIAPYYTSMRCWQDPTHKHAISEMTFMYYNQDWLRANKLDHYGITANFDFSYGYNINAEWTSRNQETLQFAIRSYWNVVDDIVATLVKK